MDERSPGDTPARRATEASPQPETADIPAKPLTRFAVAAARHWRVTLAFWLVLLAAGTYAFSSGLDREGFPAVSTPLVRVTVPYFAGDAAVADADVGEPLSKAISEVDGVVGVTSRARPNFVTLLVEFDDEYSSLEGVDLLEGVEVGVVPTSVEVEYSEIDAAAFLSRYDLLIAVISEPGSDVAELEAVADEVADYLRADPNVAVADTQRQLSESTDIATGDEVVRQVGFSRVYRQGEGGFRPSATIALDRAPNGQDTIAFSDNVTALLADAPLADGYEVQITADFAVDIQRQLSSLSSNLLSGLVAVAAVSFLLISWRTAVVTALFMITVMASSLLLLWMFGQTLNVITMFALILTLGLLVDDAIVIAEAIEASRGQASTTAGVVRLAINQVGTASLSGTLTTVLVFAPLLLVTGILGEFIRILPITVIITLLASFVLSIVLIAGLSGLFLLRGKPTSTPVTRFESFLADKLASAISLVERNRPAGLALGFAAIGLSVVVVLAAFQIAGTLSFNIFPPSKDALALLVDGQFSPGTSIEEAEANADRIDEVLLDILGDNMTSAAYFGGGTTGVFIQADLVGFDDRDLTASEYADQIETALADEPGMRVAVNQLDQGPTAEEFPFAVQISAGEDPGAAQALALEIAERLQGDTITLGNGEQVEILETIISTDGTVTRRDNDRFVEVRASFDSADTSALVLATQEKVEADWPPATVAQRGLPDDALNFDFGFESDNQNDFASAGVAFQFALIGILILITVQFRSLLQALLIMLAIPFGLFGVFAALDWSDNPISFFAIVGLTGLLGVVVNNTILLTDAANQASREGRSTPSAMAVAMQRRFRPLVATTVTTVVGLAPLALSDPFWEPMAFTIMFGLLSSTVLVIISFPFYYLAVTPIGRRFGALARSLFSRQAAS